MLNILVSTHSMEHYSNEREWSMDAQNNLINFSKAKLSEDDQFQKVMCLYDYIAITLLK
jgi:hypothetical protein